MHKSTTTNSLFLTNRSSLVGLSEAVAALHSVSSQNALDYGARQIIEVARRYRVSREMELCGRVSDLLLSLPISRGLHSVADFYSSLSRLSFASDEARLREAVIRTVDSAPAIYVPRIILEIGGTYDRLGELSEARRYYLEAAKAASGTDALMAVQASVSMAILRSDDGDHSGSLQELERLLPIIRSVCHAYPHLYYGYLNNLAVVCSRAGRTEDARGAIRVALASSLAPRFPEWHDTAREIEEAARAAPHKTAPTLKVLAGARPAPRKARHGHATKPPKIVVAAVIGLLHTSAGVHLRLLHGYALSLLQRYVTTVRIRDSP